jgi:hypothetical protein
VIFEHISQAISATRLPMIKPFGRQVIYASSMNEVNWHDPKPITLQDPLEKCSKNTFFPSLANFYDLLHARVARAGGPPAWELDHK